MVVLVQNLNPPIIEIAPMPLPPPIPAPLSPPNAVKLPVPSIVSVVPSGASKPALSVPPVRVFVPSKVKTAMF